MGRRRGGLEQHQVPAHAVGEDLAPLVEQNLQLQGPQPAVRSLQKQDPPSLPLTPPLLQR